MKRIDCIYVMYPVLNKYIFFCLLWEYVSFAKMLASIISFEKST